MAYTQVWDNSTPDGAIVQAATLDTEIQNLKKAITERMNDLVGATNWETDAVDPKQIQPASIDSAALVWGVYELNVQFDPGAAGNLDPITNWVAVYDPNSMLAADVFTIPVDGDGVYELTMEFSVYGLSGSIFRCAWWRNSVQDSTMLEKELRDGGVGSGTTSQAYAHSCIRELSAGDVLEPRARDAGGGKISATYSHITIKRLV